jgi:hypothetical protein
MKFIVLFTQLLLIIFCSYSQTQTRVERNNSNSIKRYNIDPTKISETIDGKKLFQSIEYIKLETKSECLLGAVNKAVVTEGKIFVLSSSNSLVYCFDREGKYLFVLNKKGLGPRETGEISDIAVDSFNQQIILSDSQKRNLYFYSYDGKFIERIGLKYWAYDILPINKDEILIRSSESDGLDLKLFNKKTKNIIYESIKLYPFDDICSGMGFLSVFGNTTLFSPSIRDTVYEASNTGLKARYILDFGKYSVPKNLREKSSGRVIFNYYKSNKYDYAGIISSFWETKTHIGFSYYYSKQPTFNQIIINKIENRSSQFKKVRIDGVEIAIDKLFKSTQNVNYGIIDAVQIAGIKATKPKTNGRFTSLNELISATKADDNPIIAIYTIDPNF